MRSWLFRYRHQLRALYGLPPEPRVARLLEAAQRGEDADDRSTPAGADSDGRDRAAEADRKRTDRRSA
jgi:hypothetical protein